MNGALRAACCFVANRLFAGIQFLSLALALNPCAASGQHAGPPGQVGELSEREILGLLLPGHVEPPAKSEDPNGEPEWNAIRARVTESLLTDFGLGKARFALFLVNGTTGDCTQCGFTVVGILDPVKHSVVWRLAPEHYGGHRLETLHLFKGDPRLAFTFRYDAGAHTHNSYVRQAIYRPRRLKGGGIECDLVWSDLIASGAALGATSGTMWHSRCASMDRAGTGTDWLYRRRSFFGAGLDDRSEDRATPPLDLPCDDGYQRVEIRRVERWTFQPATGLLSRASVRSERIDHAPSTRFPFSLPVRSGAWARVGQKRLAVAGHSTELLSPTEEFRIRRVNQSYGEEGVALVDRTGDAIRSLKDWHSDYFEGTLEALGWAEDESRFFVVVTFEGERALLSFSIEGIDDSWEELLDPYDTSWHDGFVMRSTRPTRSP